MGRKRKEEDDVLVTVGTRIDKQTRQEIEILRQNARITRSAMIARLLNLGLSVHRQGSSIILTPEHFR